MFSVSIFLCLVPNVSRTYISLSCAQCYNCLSFCVLCSMLPVSLCPVFPVSIFLCRVPNVARVYLFCLVPNVTRVYISMSCAQWYPCLSVSCSQCYPFLSFCVFFPMLPVSIFLYLVSNVARVYLSVFTGNIGYKTQKNRHG
jgi:hypothetical protein